MCTQVNVSQTMPSSPLNRSETPSVCRCRTTSNFGWGDRYGSGSRCHTTNLGENVWPFMIDTYTSFPRWNRPKDVVILVKRLTTKPRVRRPSALKESWCLSRLLTEDSGRDSFRVSTKSAPISREVRQREICRLRA